MTRVRRVTVIAAYVLGFWCVIPLALFWLGGTVDAQLAWQPLEQWVTTVGIVVFALGLAFTLWSMWTLSRRGDGLPISHLPPRKLVKTGPYRLARHPIYVGFTVGWFGVGLVSSSLGRTLVSTLVLWLGWQVYVRVYEEPALTRRFSGNPPPLA